MAFEAAVAVTRSLILRGSQVHLAYIRISGINSDHKTGSRADTAGLAGRQ